MRIMKKTIIVPIVLILFQCVNCAFPNIYGDIRQMSVSQASGEALFLTQLIEEGNIEEARNAAKVNPEIFLGIDSYSGYLTVDKTYNSNMFFWFFPSQSNYTEDPVLLWLQGGPGATSLFGLFEEIGPFYITKDLNLELRQYSWTNSHSVLFIDNPVGTGYSFTDGGYAQNETKVGDDLYSALQQFFTMFAEIQKNNFYVTGESYAGKYIPAIGYAIHKNNPEAKLKINLQGLSIGNGLCDPEHQLKYGDYLYQLGLIDSNTRKIFQENEEQAIKFIQNGDYTGAFQIFDNLLNGDLTTQPTLFKKATGFDNYFNYLHPVDVSTGGSTYDFLQKAEIGAALHVGNSTFGDEWVERNLVDDVMRSVAPWLVELLENYRILFYNGQLDIILAYPLTVNYLQSLDFSGAEDYEIATRHQWHVGGEIAGYVKQAGNLTEVLVRNSGHMVPSDQPEWAADLITRFTRNQPFYELEF